MTSKLGGALCLLLIAAAAIVHGSATHRWGRAGVDLDRVAAVHDHAVALADYRSTDIPSELPVMERSRVTCRQYVAPSGLPAAVVSITSGPAGAVSTHTPDVCYPGSGYKTVVAPKRESLELPNGAKATYWVAEFEKKTATSIERQRVRWAWSADGTWDVPNNHRWAYLRQPELFKLYVVTGVAPDEAVDRAGDSPAIRNFVAATFRQYADLLQGSKSQ